MIEKPEVPEGMVRIAHPEGIGCGWGGNAYVPDSDGMVVVPAAAWAELQDHGFRMPQLLASGEVDLGGAGDNEAFVRLMEQHEQLGAVHGHLLAEKAVLDAAHDELTEKHTSLETAHAELGDKLAAAEAERDAALADLEKATAPTAEDAAEKPAGDAGAGDQAAAPPARAKR